MNNRHGELAEELERRMQAGIEIVESVTDESPVSEADQNNILALGQSIEAFFISENVQPGRERFLVSLLGALIAAYQLGMRGAKE